MTIIRDIVTVITDARGCSIDYIFTALPQYTRRQITDALRLGSKRHGLFLWRKTWWADSKRLHEGTQ